MRNSFFIVVNIKYLCKKRGRISNEKEGRKMGETERKRRKKGF
jgi:hypothetical protein